MPQASFDFGMIGLGVMGRNLLLNMTDHDFSVAGLDTDPGKVNLLKSEAQDKKADGTTIASEFTAMLASPKKIMMLVPAGDPVDAVIKELIPLLKKGDVLIDGGNSHFIDTDRRIAELQPTGINFMGVGISGGEDGARHGPSIMPGGSEDGYKKLRPIFEAVAAKVNDEPCVTHIGPGSAGHYTKMVHNGIEYGLMQVISETYDVMKRGLGMDNQQIHDVYAAWNETYLQSFLIEITARIFSLKDDVTQKGILLDHILDAAAQKGTGMWTSQSAMDLQVPTPGIDLAVSMRDLSALKKERLNAAKKLESSANKFNGHAEDFLSDLKEALYFSMITIYAQGMHLLKVASDAMKYDINLKNVARIWRGGCIIRSSLLEPISEAFELNPGLLNLMTDNVLATDLIQKRNAIQAVIGQSVQLQVPVAGLSASLAYYDAYRSAWLPANLIQAQRDFFGSHTYRRIDKEGIFHTKWNG